MNKIELTASEQDKEHLHAWNLSYPRTKQRYA